MYIRWHRTRFVVVVESREARSRGIDVVVVDECDTQYARATSMNVTRNMHAHHARISHERENPLQI